VLLSDAVPHGGPGEGPVALLVAHYRLHGDEPHGAIVAADADGAVPQVRQDMVSERCSGAWSTVV
jgi:hypothetical protein